MERQILMSTSGNTTISGGGANTILGGSGASTVIGSANDVVVGGAGSMVYLGPGGATATVIGGTGAMTVFGAAAGAIDYVAAKTAGGATVVAGSGTETLNAAGSAIGVLIDFGSGGGVAEGGSGSDTIISGSGNNTLSGGAGSNFFFIDNGNAGNAVMITDFNTSDALVLSGYGLSEGQLALSTASTVGGSVVVRLSDGTSIRFLGIRSRSDLFTRANIIVATACFRSGTRIAQWCRGVGLVQNRIENLRLGDLLATPDGAHPITWIGQRRLCPPAADKMPVRVRAHAFAPNQPTHDLFLSPDHAVFTEGVLIPIRALINGTTIAAAPEPDVTYFHVQLSTHAVIYAEGLACETYLGGDEADFDQQTGTQATAAFLSPLAPRHTHGVIVERVRRTLRADAAALAR